MSDEIYHQRQCQTCSGCFPSNADLRAHIERYRSRERILLSAIAKCRAHSTDLIEKCDVACEQTHGKDEENEDACENGDDACEALCAPKTDERPRPFNCPYKDCKRTQPFDKKKKLRRHFAIHVRCEEVCVYCFRVFTVASQYIAHAGSHSEADMTKDSYIARICDRLRKRVDDELCSLLGQSLDLLNKDKNIAQKRLMEVEDFSSMIPEAQTSIPRSDSYGVNEAITNQVSLASFHDLIDTGPGGHLPTSIQRVNTLTSLPNIEEPVTINDGFADASGPALYPNSQLLNESYEDYSAPVFWNMTFPPINVAEQYHGGSNKIHTSVMTSPLLSTADRTRSMQTQNMQENEGIGLQDASAAYQDP